VALIPPGGKNGGHAFVYGCTIVFRKRRNLAGIGMRPLSRARQIGPGA
jgi:hypothetical protein